MGYDCFLKGPVYAKGLAEGRHLISKLKHIPPNYGKGSDAKNLAACPQ